MAEGFGRGCRGVSQTIPSTIRLVMGGLILIGSGACTTSPPTASDGCGTAPERRPPVVSSPADQVISRSAGRAAGMGGSAASRAVRVTGNRSIDTLLSGAVRDGVTVARRAWNDADSGNAADGDATVSYRLAPGSAPGPSQSIQVFSPLINDAPWRIEVPRTGAVLAMHAPAGRGSHDVRTVVNVGARRSDAAAIIFASCRYLEGLGNRATLRTGPP